MKEFTYQDYLTYEKICKNNIKKIFNVSIWEMLSYKNVLHDVSEEYELGTKDKDKPKEETKEKTKEKKIIHEHDKIFKLILEDNQQMANLINDTLKLRNKLTKDDIQKYKSSYITEEFQNRELDVVYKTEQFLYKAFLIEKSKNSEELFENLKKLSQKKQQKKIKSY